MFTGLVETTAEVASLTRGELGARLTVQVPQFAGEIDLGDSVAVNGCCLTVAAREADGLSFDLLGETLERTNLGTLRQGSIVNLERALPVGGRLGGHFVQGHIDCTSTVLRFEQIGSDRRLEIELPSGFARYVAFKGSIAIDGISLTVAEVSAAAFVVWIIPHTMGATNLAAKRVGDAVNIEFDLLAKYVERLLEAR